MSLRLQPLVNIIFGLALFGGVILSCTEYWLDMGAKCTCLNACLTCSNNYRGYNVSKCQIQCARTKHRFVDHFGYNNCAYGLRQPRRRYHREIIQVEEKATLILEKRVKREGIETMSPASAAVKPSTSFRNRRRHSGKKRMEESYSSS